MLKTERLHIRKFKKEDAAFVLELVNDPSFIKNIGDRKVHTLEDAEKYIEKIAMDPDALRGIGYYVVDFLGSEISIGMVGLRKRDNLDDVDIGFAFLPRFGGKGYAFESAEALMNYGKSVLKIERIVGVTNPDNLPSIRVLEKLGMKFEKMVKWPGETPEIRLYS